MENNNNICLKIINNEHIKLSHFYYSFNKDKDTLKMLIQKYPEIVNKTYENYVYEYPLENIELNKNNFIEYLKKIKN